MASFAFTNAKALLAKAGINLDSGGHDIRCMLLMTNTTVDTEEDVTTIAGFTTLDEYDGVTYVRKTLTGEVVNTDNTNNRGEFDHADIQWLTLGAGTRQAQGALFFRFITNDADSVPLYFIDSGGFPFSGNGGTIDYVVNAEGALQIT